MGKPRWLSHNYDFPPEIVEADKNLPLELAAKFRKEIAAKGLLIIEGPLIEIQPSLFPEGYIQFTVKASVGDNN